MLDEVALAHKHGVHLQLGSHMLDEVFSQHGCLDLSRAPHGCVRRPVACAQVEVEVEFWEGVCLHTISIYTISVNFTVYTGLRWAVVCSMRCLASMVA